MGSPSLQGGHGIRREVALGNRGLQEVGIGTEADGSKTGLLKTLVGDRKTVGKNTHNTQNIQALAAQCFGCLQGTLPRGNQVLDEDGPRPRFSSAFNEAAGAVLLGFGANVRKRQTQLFRDQNPLGNACGGHSGDQIAAAEGGGNSVGQLLPDEGSVFGVR